MKSKSLSQFHFIWIKKSQPFSFYLNQKISAIFIVSESKSLSHFHFIWIKKSQIFLFYLNQSLSRFHFIWIKKKQINRWTFDMCNSTGAIASKKGMSGEWGLWSTAYISMSKFRHKRVHWKKNKMLFELCERIMRQELCLSRKLEH